jgi:hypothetical protein
MLTMCYNHNNYNKINNFKWENLKNNNYQIIIIIILLINNNNYNNNSNKSNNNNNNCHLICKNNVLCRKLERKKTLEIKLIL